MAKREKIVNALLETYDIKSAEDIQDALKDILGDTLKKMLEVELDEHLGYKKGPSEPLYSTILFIINFNKIFNLIDP